MKNKTLLILVLVFLLVLAGAALLYSRLSDDVASGQISTQPPAETSDSTGPTSETEPPATPAPDFTVYDLDGNPVKLSDFQGKPVILNFWSSRCGPCQQEMPDFQKAYEKQGDEIHFLMVNVTDGSWDTLESASKFVETKGYTFPVFYDTKQEATFTYQVYSLPTTYFIDAEGNLVVYAKGAINEKTLQKGISMLIPE